MEDQYLFQPLLPTTPSGSFAVAATTTAVDESDTDNIKFFSSNTSIIFRLFSIIFIGIISMWANYEASKGFDITIINESKDSQAGKRFNLFYMSNDKATRILQNTSAFVENILYPHTDHTKKQVNHVTLQLTSKNLNRIVSVYSDKSNEFVMNISPLIMGYSNPDYAIISAIQRGMARIWLWDGESRAPPWLIDGLVEYISMLAGLDQVKEPVGGELPEFGHLCWDNKDNRVVAHFLDYCEGHNKGFVQRLNQAMRDRWDDRMVEDALGIEAKYLCESYKKLYDFPL